MHHDIEPRKPFLEFPRGATDNGLDRQIRGERLDRRMRFLARRLGDRCATFAIPAEDNHRRAAVRQRPGGFQADARGCTGDQANFTSHGVHRAPSMQSRKYSVSGTSSFAGFRLWCSRIEEHSSTHCRQMYAGNARSKVGLSIRIPTSPGTLLQKEQRGPGGLVAAPAFCAWGFAIELSSQIGLVVSLFPACS
jgi:hypothetical protein